MTIRPLAALKASDRKMARLIAATEPVDSKAWRRARPLGNPFSVLVYSIIGQQISGYAARAIAARVGNDPGALAAYHQALRFAPDYLAALEGAAGIEYKSGSEHAVPLLDHLLKLQPDNSTAHASKRPKN